MISFELRHLLVFALYFAGTVLILVGVPLNRQGLVKLAKAAASVGFGLHTLDLAAILFLGRAAAFNQALFYLSLFSWVLLLIYFLLWWRLRIDFLAMTAAPLALLLFTSSFAFSGLKMIVPKTASALFFGLHIGSLYLSMAFLAVAFGAGLAFLYMERKIKTKTNLGNFRRDMPSLSAFDRANHISTMFGFPLYTLGLLSGFIWSGLARASVVTWHPREVTALITWLLFAFLFHQRLALGWQGRKPARIAVWVFLFTMTSMLVIHWLFPVHHSLVAPK